MVNETEVVTAPLAGRDNTSVNAYWQDESAAAPWSEWQPDVTSGDGWGTQDTTSAFPGIQADDGESSDAQTRRPPRTVGMSTSTCQTYTP